MSWARLPILFMAPTGYVALLLAAAVALPFCPDRIPVQLASSTPYLPFDVISMSAPRKVFAHYMPNFPISLDNLSADRDYYTTQYLSPDGEGGIHAAYGGLLRDRPLPRAPISRADWKKADLQNEISQARSVGIDGFAVDVIQLRSESSVVVDILQAAQESDDFAVLLTADMTGPLGALSPSDFANEFAPYLSAPSAFHLSDGRPVLGAFGAEQQSVEWWSSVMTLLRDQHSFSAAFVPTFLNATGNLEKYAPLSYGFSNWGGRNPQGMSVADRGPGSPIDLVRRTHALGKIWMQPVAFQDNRPRTGIFEEAANGATNRMAWQLAIEQGAEWVQLITWNDYAEMTALAPSVAHGWRLLDMNAYSIAQFKTGRAPMIVRDALYVSYRNQPAAAKPTYPQSLLMSLARGGIPARDELEVVAYSTAPSTVRATTGSNEESCDVPAGVGVCTFPLGLGPISVGLVRAGVQVAAAQSATDVTDHPFVQDLQYRVAGGLR